MSVVTENKCIYRYIKSGCKCNNINSIDNEYYCNKHLNKKNKIYEILDKSLHNDLAIDKYNILKIITYIYDSCEEIEKKDKEDYFIVCIKYLCNNKDSIATLINTQNCKLININLSKNKMIKQLYKIIYNIYLFSKNIKAINNIKKLQRIWLNKLINKVNIKLNDNEEPKNTEDPFTYDLIKDIPENLKFNYKDSNNNIYTFNALEFYYFIKNIGKWNPYTRETISDEVINNLYNFLKYKRININSIDEKYKWKTDKEAYTEVSYIMEKYGFYTDVKWFMSLKYDIVINTITSYNKISINIPNYNTFFKPSVLKKDNYVFEFCNQILELFKDANNNYVLCCNFIRALSLNNIYFYNNIPDWVYDISTPDYNIEYNNVFGNTFYSNIMVSGYNGHLFVVM